MNFQKTGFVTFITCTLLILLANTGFSATYYVNATGGRDTNSGTTEGNAWKTIGKINSVNFTSGDTIKLKRGHTWTDATLTLNSTRLGTSGITVEDYGIGAKPRIDGNSVQPIVINHALVDLTLKNIDISGSDTSGNRCHINGVNGLTIDGIDYNGYTGSIKYYRLHAISMGSVDGDIEIKNCTIQNLLKDTWAKTITAWGDEDAHAIIFWYPVDAKKSGTVSVHDNVIHDVYADCIQTACVQTTTNIFDNHFYNFGENAVDHKKGRYITIYNNRISSGGVRGGMGTSIGGGGGSIYCTDCVAQDITVRGNYFYDTPTKVIAIDGFFMNNYKVYENYFKDVGLGVAMGNAFNIQVYNNVFELTAAAHSSLLGTKLSAIRVQNSVKSDAKVYNNTIYVSSSNHLYGIAWEPSVTQTGLEIKNNIVYMTRNSSKVYPFAVYPNDGDGSNATINNNLYHNPNHSNRIFWNWTTYDSTEQVYYTTRYEVGSLFVDPGLSNVESSELWASGANSAIVDAGTATVKNAGLHQNSSWPNDVLVIERANYGAYDIGAYEYLSPPLLPPAKLELLFKE